VIFTVPRDTPATVPVVAPTDAIKGLLLLQVPPAVASLNVAVHPIQVLVLPMIGAIANEATDKNVNKSKKVKNFFMTVLICNGEAESKEYKWQGQ
jgi:hypothetical protein